MHSSSRRVQSLLTLTLTPTTTNSFSFLSSLFFPYFIFFIAFAFIVPISNAQLLTCKTINTSLLTYCGPYLDDSLRIPSQLNESDADMYAKEGTEVPLDQQCGFYNELVYQCNKFFVRCVDPPENSTNTNATFVGMCQSVCYRAAKWEDGICRGFNLDIECLDSGFYDPGSPPQCFLIDYDVAAKSKTWQYVVGGVIGGVGLVIAVWLLVRWIKDKLWKPDPLAPIEFEDERKKQQQKAGYGNLNQDGSSPFTATGQPAPEFRTAQEARMDLREREQRESAAAVESASATAPSADPRRESVTEVKDAAD